MSFCPSASDPRRRAACPCSWRRSVQRPSGSWRECSASMGCGRRRCAMPRRRTACWRKRLRRGRLFACSSSMPGLREEASFWPRLCLTPLVRRFRRRSSWCRPWIDWHWRRSGNAFPRSTFLEKPVSWAKLAEAIDGALGIRRLEPLPGTVSAEVPGATRMLRILLVEDTPANQKVALRLLSKRGHYVQVASNGAEAVAPGAGGMFRRDPDGRADAGHGRFRGDATDPRAQRAGRQRSWRSTSRLSR